MKQQPISIVGGGIAGLTTAHQLARFGVTSHVFEQADQFSEIGAGLQISPNAARCLFQMGLEDELLAKSCEPDGISIHQLSNNKLIRRFLFKDRMRTRYGAPYLVCKRSALHKILANHCQSSDKITLHTDHQLQDIKSAKDHSHLVFSNGKEFKASMVIGADGLWSACRPRAISKQPPTLTNYCAWRALIPLAKAPSFLRASDVSLWLGRNLHLVVYQINETQINLVAISKRPANLQQIGWTRAMEREAFLAAMPPMAPALKPLFDHMNEIGVWNLFEVPNLPRWSKDRLILIGDAAHPILPFMAQGAAMAIEDGVTLAALIASQGKSHQGSTIGDQFQQARKARVNAIANQSRRNGTIFHLGFGMDRLRNFALRHMSEERFFAKYDSIYQGS